MPQLDNLLPNTPEELEQSIRRDRVFLNNPVMMQGLGLAPLIVVATTMRNSVILSIAAILLLVSTRLVGAMLARITYFRFRGIAYAVSAGMLYIGVYFLLNLLFSQAQLALLGLYLPLLIVDPIILKRYENPRRESLHSAWRKGLITSMGYALVLLVVGGLREFLGAGMLYGKQMVDSALLPFLQMPAGGFILLALLMALWRSLATSFKKQLYMSQGGNKP